MLIGKSIVFRTWLYELLKKSEIEINFNSDVYQDELSPFVNYKREAFELELKNGELKLFPNAVIGIFPQAGSYLVPDYMHLIEQSDVQDLEKNFSINAQPHLKYLNHKIFTRW